MAPGEGCGEIDWRGDLQAADAVCADVANGSSQSMSDGAIFNMLQTRGSERVSDGHHNHSLQKGVCRFWVQKAVNLSPHQSCRYKAAGDEIPQVLDAFDAGPHIIPQLSIHNTKGRRNRKNRPRLTQEEVLRRW